MKILNSKVHGIIDYLVVIFLYTSPLLFKLPPLTTTFTYSLGAAHLLLTLGTNYECGIFKFIPLKIHGGIEFIVSIVLIGVAFYLGSREGESARNFYLCFSVAVFVFWLITNYDSFNGNETKIES